jgi:hypothetical protein
MASALSWWPWKEEVAVLVLGATATAPLIKGTGRNLERAINGVGHVEAAVASDTGAIDGGAEAEATAQPFLMQATESA